MARQTFKVEGLRELEMALRGLPAATAKNVLQRALIKAGAPVAEAASRNARALSGKLQRSFGVSQKLSRRQKSQHKKESTVEVFAGPGALTQAITEEFGTAHSAPNPTLRPSWDSNKMGVLKSIKDDLAEEIDKAASRLARKAAKLAALNK